MFIFHSHVRQWYSVAIIPTVMSYHTGLQRPIAEIVTMTIHVRVMPQSAGSPAVDHNGFVSSPPLYHQHMLNDCHDGRGRGAQTVNSPAGHLELSHLVLLARL